MATEASHHHKTTKASHHHKATEASHHHKATEASHHHKATEASHHHKATEASHHKATEAANVKPIHFITTVTDITRVKLSPNEQMQSKTMHNHMIMSQLRPMRSH